MRPVDAIDAPTTITLKFISGSEARDHVVVEHDGVDAARLPLLERLAHADHHAQARVQRLLRLRRDERLDSPWFVRRSEWPRMTHFTP